MHERFTHTHPPTHTHALVCASNCQKRSAMLAENAIQRIGRHITSAELLPSIVNKQNLTTHPKHVIFCLCNFPSQELADGRECIALGPGDHLSRELLMAAIISKVIGTLSFFQCFCFPANYTLLIYCGTSVKYPFHQRMFNLTPCC